MAKTKRQKKQSDRDKAKNSKAKGLWKQKHLKFKTYRENPTIKFRKELDNLKQLGADEQKIISKLIEYSNHILFKPKKDTLIKARKTWNCVRINRRKLISEEKCFVCDQKAREWHHIIQLQNGGLPAKKAGIIPICRPCHIQIHPWMQPNPDR